MEIPEKYRDIYSQAKKIDAKLKESSSGSNEGSVLKSKTSAVRSVEGMVYCEKKMNEWKISFEAAKKELNDYGINTDNI